MHLSRLASLLIAMFFLLSFIMIGTTTADDTIDNLVEAEFDIDFVTGNTLNVNIIIDAYKLTTDQTYDADGIKGASEQELGAFRLLLYQMLNAQLGVTFQNANITNFTMPTFDGERFNEELTVELTPSFFGLDESVNVDDFINGILDMGGRVNYSLNLKAEPGWNNTYLVGLHHSLEFMRTTGSLRGDDISWTVRNWKEEFPDEVAEMQLGKKNPTTPSLSSEDISLEFILDSKDAEQVSLENNIVIRGADIQVYNILPDFITNLDFIPADGIRLFVDNGFITWEDCYEKTISPLEEIIIQTIESSSFNQTLDISFSWDSATTADCLTPYQISNMDNEPAVRAILTDDDIALKIFDISSRAVFGLIHSGAGANISEEDINFGDGLNNIGHDYSIKLFMPSGLYIDGENAYIWNDTLPISGIFEADDAPSYSDEDKSTIVEIEVKSTDLNLLSFITGTTELTFELYMRETRNYNVTTLPDAFTLPEKLAIDYLNSDAFRLCIEEEVFSKENINTFLSDDKTHFESLLLQILPGLEISGNVNRDVFEDSLILWDGNLSDIDAYPPVKTESYAYNSYPMSFDFSLLPPSVDIPTKTFNFSGLPDQEVTYKMIFPHGLSINVNDPSNKTKVAEMEDGRYYFEIKFSDSESDLTVEILCKMSPSALFVIGIFLPCIISLVIAIFLVIVIYLIRKKRKGKKITPTFDEEEITGYEEEDFYVPPPPGSK
jgi:hypothetical protein